MEGRPAQVSSHLGFCCVRQEVRKGDKCLRLRHFKHVGLVHEMSNTFEGLDWVGPIKGVLLHREFQVLSVDAYLSGIS